MQLTTHDIVDLFNNSHAWTVLTDGSFVACSYVSFEYTPIAKVSREELAQIHPLLPDTLRGFMQWQEFTLGYSYTDRTNIGIILRYLKEPSVVFEHASGGQHTFSEVTSIDNLDADKKTVWLHGKVYMFSCYDSVNGRIMVPFATQDDTLLVSTEHLDKIYPGWQTRWTVGQTLGLDSTELSKHAFMPSINVADNISLSDIHYE